jgi:hypothetical protein
MVYDLSAERHPAKIDGLPPAPSRKCSWNPLEKAEELVQAAARDHALVELRREKLQKETAEKPHNSCAFIRMIKRIGSWRRTNCSVRFARFPHLFARPLTGPFDSNEAVTRDCSYARTNLDQILDLEA